jgi:hypothetical protein
MAASKRPSKKTAPGKPAARKRKGSTSAPRVMKASPPVVAKPAAKTATTASAEKPAAKKVKRIRGSYAMPETDYARIGKLKATGKRAGLKIKKNELFRLGLQMLQTVPAGELHDMVLVMRMSEARTGKKARSGQN